MPKNFLPLKTTISELSTLNINLKIINKSQITNKLETGTESGELVALQSGIGVVTYIC
jgi:hypothetical protein